MCKAPLSDSNSRKRLANFRSNWDKWRALLQKLVEDPAGYFVCPTSRELICEQKESSTHIKLPYPICLYGVPMRVSTKCRSSLAVFIDGEYELDMLDKGEELRRIKSLVAFYDMSGKNRKSFKLIDAYHFDFWDTPPLTHAPHPVFHAQRDFKYSELEPKFNTVLQQIPAASGVTLDTPERDKDNLFKFGRFRIPTPQLDILNLGAVVAADQLVAYDNDVQWSNFQRLLEAIHGEDGSANHVTVPDQHRAGIYNTPRRKLSDWYVAKAS